VARRPDITLNQLRYFLEAATTLSMTQAAQNLLVAQSAVSAAVPPHVVLPAGHPLAGRRQVRLRDLACEQFILLDLPRSREYFLGVHAAAGVEPLIRHRSQGYETVRAMVARGLGYSILNARPRHDRTYGGHQVVVRPIADDVPALPFVVASLASYRATARARAVTAVVHAMASRLLDPV
jgi:DNA-binding transcriptional LysR family regulator